MNTNIKVELTDEQRALFNNALCKKGLASRKDVTAWVNEAVERLLTTQEHNNDQGTEVEPLADTPVERTAEGRAEARGDRSVREFVPSRGDEGYLYSGEDPELAAACSSVLDGLDFIQQYTWTALERNRK